MPEVIEKDCWIGFDLGGTKMLAAVFDSKLKQLGSERKKTKGHLGVEAGLERMIGTIRTALDDAGVDANRLRGIGVGCPGPLDLKRGVILEAPNLGWENAPVKKTLENEFGCPTVIANDVDTGVFGEYRFGAGKNERCVLGIFPGTGVGGGCVYEGRIFRGKTMSCMEIGHVQLMADGPRAGTGQIGSLEAVASRLAIAGQAAQAAFRGQAPYLRSVAGTDLSKIRSGVLADAIKNGDQVIKQIIVDAATHIGIALAGAVNLLAPDVVVLGGGLVEAMPDLIVESVTKSVRKHVLPSFLDTFEVVAAELADDATVKGAAAWAEVVFRETSPIS
jgi:glucokinase